MNPFKLNVFLMKNSIESQEFLNFYSFFKFYKKFLSFKKIDLIFLKILH